MERALVDDAEDTNEISPPPMEGVSDTGQMQECILEIGAFVRGGIPGLDRLNRVLPNIFKAYDIVDHVDKRRCLLAHGLVPSKNGYFVGNHAAPSSDVCI